MSSKQLPDQFAAPDAPNEPLQSGATPDSHPLMDASALVYAPAAIARFDRQLRICQVWPGVEALAGIAPSLGVSTHELGMPEPLAASWEAELAAVFATGEPRSAAFSCPAPDGERCFETYLAPELAAGGAVESVLSVSRDITARNAAEEGCRRESIATLASGIAHACNNLCAIILGNAELALADLPADSPLRGGIEQIVATSKRAADLTQQLLLYAGKVHCGLRPLRLNELVRDHVTLPGTAIVSPSRVRLALAPALPGVLGDEELLRRALLNLVSNAVEALSPSDGSVTITTAKQHMSAGDLARCRVGAREPPGDYVALAVTDTGAGMDAATLSRIFEPFFSTKFIGRGLGLAVVQGIVSVHQGALQVISSPGHGSTFTLFLPAAAGQAE